MINLSRQRLAAYVVLAAVAGWYAAGVFAPSHKPRPVVTLVQRLLRWGALFWFFSEPPPAPVNGINAHPQPDDHTPLGADGFPLVDHRRAF